MAEPLPSIDSLSCNLPSAPSWPEGCPELQDCNYADLPFEYDWENDEQWFELVVKVTRTLTEPARKLAVDFARAVVIQGNKQYIQAFKKFCPDYPFPKIAARWIWEEYGASQLHDYIDRVRLDVDTRDQKPPRTVMYVENFLPGHDFGNDPCYALLVKGVSDRFVEIAKAHALGSNLAASICQVIPSLANDEAGVSKEGNAWRRSARAMALHQYLATLVMALAVSEGPRELNDYNQSIEDMFWRTKDVDECLKLHRAITAFKGSAKALVGANEMPAEFDPSGLED